MSSSEHPRPPTAPRARRRGLTGEARSHSTPSTSRDLPSPEEIQQTFARTITAYVQRRCDGEEFPILARDATDGEVSATEAVITAAALLEAVDVEIFELGMWKALGTLA